MGESRLKLAKHEEILMSCAGVQTAAGRVQVRWESDSAATPMGQLAYFIEFLTLTGLWSRWLEGYPLSYSSPNAPSKADVLGTWMLSVLSGDGGFRPAYNPQLASDTESLVIVGVDVATAGSDQGRMVPMLEQVTERCGRAPDAWLVDVYGPAPQPKDKAVDPHQAKSPDSEAVAAWRERMGTDEANEIYKKRAATAECVNAQSRTRDLQQLRVRGRDKVKCVMLMFALAHNLMRMAALAPDLVGIGTGTSPIPGMGA
jgi:hypothetical protein